MKKIILIICIVLICSFALGRGLGMRMDTSISPLPPDSGTLTGDGILRVTDAGGSVLRVTDAGGSVVRVSP